MQHSLSWKRMALLAWFLFAGPAPVAVASEAAVSVGNGHFITLRPDGDLASTWPLKLQGVRELTVKLVALSGEQTKTCATFAHSWKPGPKNQPSEGEILLLYKRQTDEQIIPSLGFHAGEGAGKFEASGVKVKGKYLCGARTPADRALSPKEEHLLECAVVADEAGAKSVRDAVKDFVALTTLTTVKDVRTWAKKNPKVTVIVLTVSWLPAE